MKEACRQSTLGTFTASALRACLPRVWRDNSLLLREAGLDGSAPLRRSPFVWEAVALAAGAFALGSLILNPLRALAPWLIRFPPEAQLPIRAFMLGLPAWLCARHLLQGSGFAHRDSDGGPPRSEDDLWAAKISLWLMPALVAWGVVGALGSVQGFALQAESYGWRHALTWGVASPPAGAMCRVWDALNRGAGEALQAALVVGVTVRVALLNPAPFVSVGAGLVAQLAWQTVPVFGGMPVGLNSPSGMGMLANAALVSLLQTLWHAFPVLAAWRGLRGRVLRAHGHQASD